MRPSCGNCARKHIAQAEVLMQESLLGYPLHAWLAVGQLAEAEAELLRDYPEEALYVRTERAKYIEGLTFSLNEKDEIVLQSDYQIDTIEMLRRITSIEILEEQAKDQTTT